MAVVQQTTSSTVDQSPDCIPVRLLEVELGQPLPTITAFNEKNGKRYQRARCLVRLHTQPLGLVDLEIDKEELIPDEYAPKIWQELSVQINQHLQQDGFPALTELTAEGLPSSSVPRCREERDKFLADAPFVSVVVPTHDRVDRLALCLRSLLALHYPHYEIIVVDNAPSTSATADLIKQMSVNEPTVRYTREDRPGPSWARNCGIKIAKGKIIAFVDDDIIVDSYWLVEMVKAFSVSDKVACVTGLVLPLELETPAQIWFEDRDGYVPQFTQQIFDMTEHRPKDRLFPYTADRLGGGGNTALTAEFLQRVGGFDPALGGNGPARCCQDVALFFQVIVQGYQLVYTPAPLVHHHHYRDYESLRKRTYNQGIGYTAYLTKCLLENPYLMLDFMSKVPYGLFCALNPWSPKSSRKQTHYPKELGKELGKLRWKGMMRGPLAYLRSRQLMRKLQDVTVPLEV